MYISKDAKSNADELTIKIGKRFDNFFDFIWIKIFLFCNNFLFNFFFKNLKMIILDLNYKHYF
jgi:hypothetical protein